MARQTGALTLLIGSLILFSATWLDITDSSLKQSISMTSSYGMFSFIFFQAAAVAKQYRDSYVDNIKTRDTISQLISELASKNKTLESINTNLETVIDDSARETTSIMQHVPIGYYC